MQEFFRKFAHRVSLAVGSATAFLLAMTAVLLWALSGPVFDFSDTWQLVINTGTTVITFLVVFIIQNTQNRDNKALHLKLDELIRASGGARTDLVDLEELSDDELERLQRQFRELHSQYGRQAEVVSKLYGSRHSRDPGEQNSEEG